MDYLAQLKEFLGAPVGDAEARAISRAVVSGHMCELQVAVAGKVWKARQLAQEGDQAGAAVALEEARRLKAAYERARSELAAIDGPGVSVGAARLELAAIDGPGGSVGAGCERAGPDLADADGPGWRDGVPSAERAYGPVDVSVVGCGRRLTGPWR